MLGGALTPCQSCGEISAARAQAQLGNRKAERVCSGSVWSVPAFRAGEGAVPRSNIMLFLPILHDGEGFELEDPKPRSSDPGRGGCRTELPPGRRVAKRASRGLRLTALAALAIGFTGVSGTASMPVREHCGPDGHRNAWGRCAPDGLRHCPPERPRNRWGLCVRNLY